MKAIVFLFCLLLRAGAAQELRPVEGRLVSEIPVDLSRFTVKLRGLERSDYSPGAMVDFDGSFSFSGIPVGTYMLYVFGPYGDEITSQPLNVTIATPPALVRLPGRAPARPTGETVSVARLLHRPEKHALRAARKALSLSEKHEYRKAAEQLELAVALDPQFSDAYNNLGVQYLRLGRFAEAIAAFERALALDPASSLLSRNLDVARRLGRRAAAAPDSAK